MYSVIYSDDAKESITKYKKSNPASFKKTQKLVQDLHLHPRTDIGKPEALKWAGENVFSREVNKKDRLVYEIYDEPEEVYVISVEGHYNDK